MTMTISEPLGWTLAVLWLAALTFKGYQHWLEYQAFKAHRAMAAAQAVAMKAQRENRIMHPHAN